MVEAFLDVCSRQPGTLALHCAPGLGLTSTLIAAWLVLFRVRLHTRESWIEEGRGGDECASEEPRRRIERMERELQRLRQVKRGTGVGTARDIDIEIIERGRRRV